MGCSCSSCRRRRRPLWLSLFFSLVHDALTTHTARVAELPSAVRACLVSLLLHGPPQAGRQCLQCMAALAAHLAKHGSARQPALEHDVARILQWLLSTLISQPLPAALMEPISDALLACCVAVPQRIRQLATAAIHDWQQQQQQQQQRDKQSWWAEDSSASLVAVELSGLQSSVERLLSSNGVRADLSMENKRSMRANVLHFKNAVSWGVS